MPDPAPRPVTPRPDPAGADLGSLVELGLAEPQPEPSSEPPPPPVLNPFMEPLYDPPDDAA
jgi:hypothetical protein